MSAGSTPVTNPLPATIPTRQAPITSKFPARSDRIERMTTGKVLSAACLAATRESKRREYRVRSPEPILAAAGRLAEQFLHTHAPLAATSSRWQCASCALASTIAEQADSAA
jgi:hypothetical protein